MDCFKNVRTFPHVESILPREVPFNVITSQFIRFGRRTSCFGDFMESASDLVARMCNHGYDPRAVERKVQSFERYWYRYCLHLGRWRYFIEQFPALVRRTKRKACRASLLWAKRRRGDAVWSNLTSTKAVESKTKLKLNH